MKQRASPYLEERYVGHGKTLLDFKDAVLTEIAEAMALREGIDVESDPQSVETYEQAILDCAWDLLDEAMFELSRYGQSGAETDFVRSVREWFRRLKDDGGRG